VVSVVAGNAQALAGNGAQEGNRTPDLRTTLQHYAQATPEGLLKASESLVEAVGLEDSSLVAKITNL